MLFDTLYSASTGLNVSSLGIQVAGQNMSNVNTAGYIREQLNIGTALSKTSPQGNIGTGAQSLGVTQIIDQYLEERLRNAQSDTANSATQSNWYSHLETVLNEMTTNDVSSSLETFFASIANVLNQPENLTNREMVVQYGQELADKIKSIDTAITAMEEDINKSIASAAEEINLLTSTIQQLNKDIARLEAGQSPGTQAVTLRDERYVALDKLSQLINIKVTENADTGAVTVTCGGDILVSEGLRNEVFVEYRDNQNGTPKAELTIAPFSAPLSATSGTVKGLYASRDVVLGGFASQFNTFANDLITEFNSIYTSGQGLTGYNDLTSLSAVSDTTVPLNEAGLSFTPENGTFNLLITNTKTGVTIDSRIDVQLHDITVSDPFALQPPQPSEGTSLDDLVTAINDISGISATLTSRNELRITSDSPDISFSFANDTSGVLAALGINVFFTGTGSSDISVNQQLHSDPSKFAASRNGIGTDTLTAVELAAMPETMKESLGNKSITQSYQSIIDRNSIAAGTVKAISAADISYQSSLLTQRQSVSGVNIDDETINLLVFQRSYQAASKLVSIVNEMLETLLTM
ncbi:MAG: flagellar hook-associated protein FlgK [Planctomycetaceae bacterium]|jgi:flagellar hook-associated protein 1 FlgK|nr:flagellar hook-associated protein FlgK [Planctomycetaceae bacterium]